MTSKSKPIERPMDDGDWAEQVVIAFSNINSDLQRNLTIMQLVHDHLGEKTFQELNKIVMKNPPPNHKMH